MSASLRNAAAAQSELFIELNAQHIAASSRPVFARIGNERAMSGRMIG
ncbi:MAG: hypothetical protein AB7G47_18690 [Mycolicibacterium sp.]